MPSEPRRTQDPEGSEKDREPENPAERYGSSATALGPDPHALVERLLKTIGQDLGRRPTADDFADALPELARLPLYAPEDRLLGAFFLAALSELDRPSRLAIEYELGLAGDPAAGVGTRRGEAGEVIKSTLANTAMIWRARYTLARIIARLIQAGHALPSTPGPLD